MQGKIFFEGWGSMGFLELSDQVCGATYREKVYGVQKALVRAKHSLSKRESS